jgi:hypothetical protein
MFLRYAQMGPQGDLSAIASAKVDPLGPPRETTVPTSSRIH